MIYRTHLINFGYDKYVGLCLKQAKEEAESCGFETVVYENDTPILTWSPVGGWRWLGTQK
jgi:hypothetical protein